MKWIFFFTLFINCSSFAASSGNPTFFEPYLGYLGSNFSENITDISGTVNGTTISSAKETITGTPTGVTFGLRLYNKFFDQIMLGADWGLGISSGNLAIGYLTGIGNFNFVRSSPSLLIGWDLPTILLPRIWASYSPIDSMSLSTSDSSSSDSYTGTSYKLGVSVDWWIQLGIEYGVHTYTSLNGNKLPYTDKFNNVNMTQEKVVFKDIILTISYPFSI